MTAEIDLSPGTRLRSAVCSTEVIVVKSPAAPVDLCCGGAPMLGLGDEPGVADLDPAHAGGTLLGKRYVELASGLELLCTKPGDGALSIDSEPLVIKEAKPLPSSD